MAKLLTAIGLMSGTSMDGIDVALVETDGDGIFHFGPTMAMAYPPAFKGRLERGLLDAQAIKERTDRPGDLVALEQALTDFHAQVVNRFLTENGLAVHSIDLLGFHGQTVLHRPNEGVTIQLGDGQALADATGITTVYDMRAADMEAGGQGAPLIPVFHRALAGSLKNTGPTCFVNIGGISNITYVDGETLIAFDTGPGNALIDQWVAQKAGIPFDSGGTIASEGRVLASVVNRYLAAPFFDESGPKSLDRNDFPPLESGSAELADGARSLARLTAEAIAKSLDQLPTAPARWIISGGGRLNVTIMGDLAEILDGAEVQTAEAAGFDGDMMEAQAFAYLAVRARRSLSLTFPTTTGCRGAVTGGKTVAPQTTPSPLPGLAR
ncbi:MAG: anhydro-N-acetylmuramic acid kinase [Pseudomonadota bacterium]